MEKTLIVAKVVDGPVADQLGQAYGVGNLSAQFDQRNYRRSRRVNVRRIKTISEVFGPTVAEKKSFRPKVIAAAQDRCKIRPSLLTANHVGKIRRGPHGQATLSNLRRGDDA